MLIHAAKITSNKENRKAAFIERLGSSKVSLNLHPAEE